jgi:[ribosomal protein S18]-alanine N-acetyltransferase
MAPASCNVRPGRAGDLEAVARIQALSPETAQWTVADFLAHDFLVAERDGRVAGFLVARQVAEGEFEVLNLAVDPAWRRQGVARRLFENWAAVHSGTVYLEVRESNTPAIKFYNSIGFQSVGRRPEYYDYPPEAAVVMRFHPCYSVGGRSEPS